jgi:hypothetical protein
MLRHSIVAAWYRTWHPLLISNSEPTVIWPQQAALYHSHHMRIMIMATKKTTFKVTKVNKNPRVDAAPKKAKQALVTHLAATTQISFVAERPEGRSKTSHKSRVLALVPKKGAIAFKELVTKAEAEKIKPARVAQFLTVLARDRLIELA